MRDLHKEISAQIIEAMKAGELPWTQPWHNRAGGSVGSLMPHNAASGRAYSGVNVTLLWMRAKRCGYESNRWVTFKQAKKAGGFVREDEKGTPIVFVSTIVKKDEETKKEKRIAFLKYYYVFNLDQCDGLDALKTAPLAKPPFENEDERDASIEDMVRATGATITHGEGQAYYAPTQDRVNMPRFESFKTSAHYYSTLFHELGHWTGAGHRLDRLKKSARFGSAEYAYEELVAELTAAFIGAEYGIALVSHSAAYLQTWIRACEQHDKLFVSACAAASAAVAYLRDTVNAADIAEEPLAA